MNLINALEEKYRERAEERGGTKQPKSKTDGPRLVNGEHTHTKKVPTGETSCARHSRRGIVVSETIPPSTEPLTAKSGQTELRSRRLLLPLGQRKGGAADEVA